MIDQLNHLFAEALRGLDAAAGQAAKWEIPKDAALGDLSSTVAFKLAASQRRAPAAVAEDLATTLRAHVKGSSIGSWIDRIEATRGFVNVFLSAPALAHVVRQVRRLGPRYGTSRAESSSRVLVEFVSANPTGPLSVAHGRQAVVGDALVRLLRSQGASVTTEYYLNDEGRQIDLLGQSLRARYEEQLGRSAAIPEEGYHGAYVLESAAKLVAEQQDRLLRQPPEWFVQRGMVEQLARIKEDLARFGLVFESWTSQRDLRISGKVDRALEALRQRDVLYEADGALWFASTKFGDDKDRVIRKQGGELTYLAPDIAYHQLKFTRGYTRLINLWGPDHHGYIARVRAALSALGLPADHLIIRIVQLVTLSRQGKPVPMSKRQGEFVTFRQVLDEIGADATRFFFLMRTMESHLDVDLELAKSQSQENPVYYVQYAHARICSILAHAKSRLPWWARVGALRLPLLDQPEERLVLRHVFQYPLVVRLCAQALEPHGLTVYLQRLAEAFHVFYSKHRVVSDDAARSRARIALVHAVRQVLANGLSLLGVSAPQRM